jgi:hypothetical protein
MHVRHSALLSQSALCGCRHEHTHLKFKQYLCRANLLLDNRACSTGHNSEHVDMHTTPAGVNSTSTLSQTKHTQTPYNPCNRDATHPAGMTPQALPP